MTNGTSQTEAVQAFSQHPLSAAFPPMAPDDLQRLVLDIQQHGLRTPITILDGMVLDGWSRHEVCGLLKIEPSTVQFPVDQDPVDFVLAMNMARRHLTASQKAAAVVACNAWAPTHRPNKVAAAATLTNQQMAEAAGVSPRTIRDAKAAVTAGLGKAIRDGKLTVERAAAIAKLPEPERQSAIEAPKAPKPKIEITDCDFKARISELEGLVAEREGEIRDMAALLEEMVDENKALTAMVNAKNLGEALIQVTKARETTRVFQGRNKGLINQVSELTKTAKKWQTRAQRLEKGKPVEALEAEVLAPMDDDFPMEECGAPSPSWFNGEVAS